MQLSGDLIEIGEFYLQYLEEIRVRSFGLRQVLCTVLTYRTLQVLISLTPQMGGWVGEREEGKDVNQTLNVFFFPPKVQTKKKRSICVVLFSLFFLLSSLFLICTDSQNNRREFLVEIKLLKLYSSWVHIVSSTYTDEMIDLKSGRTI